ncbi:MAG: hypothetical protein ABSC48_19065 [Terracidiphilus sp.]|jgi:hypothetical protein
MKAMVHLAMAGLCALATAGCLAQTAGQPAKVGDLQVKEVNLSEIDTSHVKLAVDLNLTAAQSATFENLRLCSLHLNGLPVFAAPLNQEIVLKKGVATALPPLYVTILFRDLHTVAPLRRMIENQSVRIEGEMVAGVRLTTIEKLALHTQHPTVELDLAQDVPVQIRVSDFERGMALSALELIDSGLQATATANKYIPGTKPQWIRDLEARAPASLFAVESSYALAEGDTNYPVVSIHLGFRVASSPVVTTAEAQAPWKYDAEFLGAVQSGAAKLVKNSEEIQLRPVGQGDPLRLSAKDFTLEMRGTAEEDNLIAVSNGGHGKIQVLRRASPASLALLTLRAPASPDLPAGQTAGLAAGQGAGLSVASAAVAAQESWEQVAVFRLREDAVTRKPSVEVLQLGARRDGKSIHLTEPVDGAVFGSPIVTPDGVIGLVQDEQAGAFLPADLLTPVPAAAPVPAAVPVPAPTTVQ